MPFGHARASVRRFPTCGKPVVLRSSRLPVVTIVTLPETQKASVAGMKNWKQREKDFNEWFAFAGKVMHQIALLLLMVVGLLVAVISVTAVSVLGVQDLLRRLAH